MYDSSPALCQICSSTDIHLGQLSAGLPPVTIRLSFFQAASVQCYVCLNCGSVAPWIEHQELEVIRAAKAKQDQKASGQ